MIAYVHKDLFGECNLYRIPNSDRVLFIRLGLTIYNNVRHEVLIILYETLS